MAISAYIKKYFSPSTKTRVRDVVRELPKAEIETGKKIVRGLQITGQSALRGYASVGSFLSGYLSPSEVKNRLEGKPIRGFTPKTTFQKELFGTDKEISLRSVASEVSPRLGKSKIGPIAGLALGTADLVPGGGQSIKTTAGLLKNVNKADDAVRVASKALGISSKFLTKYGDDLARLTKAQDIEEVLTRALNASRGKVTRGFVQSTREIMPEAKKVAGQYIPRETDQLAIRARNLVKSDIAGAERLALEGSDDKAIATAAELIKHYGEEAAKTSDEATRVSLYERAANIANPVAARLTEQGRAVQAAAILGRLTPEGQLRFAAREIQRYNESVASARGGILGLRKKIPELTGQQADQILTEMKAVESMDDGIEKAMRFQTLQNTISDLVPTPLWKKAVAVWKAGLLTGVKTTGLNLFSNISHSTTEAAKDVPAAIVDSVASLFTGKRTKTFTLRGASTGIGEGFTKGARYWKTGFDERNIGTKLDYKRINFGKGAVAKAFQRYTDTIFRSLGSADQPFYYGALSRSLTDQAIAQGKNQGLKGQALKEFAENLVSDPTEEMIRYATADAATAVFQNETYLGKAAKQLQNIPIVGEILIPFGRTPSAVAMQIINYSPVGVVKAIIENIGKGRFDQRTFSQAVGRGLTGTAVLYIGTKLGEKGLITLDRPTTEREQKLWEIEGRKPNSIKIGDKWRSPAVLGPAGNLLLVGGHFQKALEESGSPTEGLGKALLGSAKSFGEQTFLTGVNQALGALNDPGRYAESYLGNLVSSVVPTIVSDVARATDPLERRPETVLQRIKSRIPGLRNRLEPQVDVLGKERESVGNPIEILIDPTRPSPDIATPLVKEFRRLSDEGYPVSPTLLGDKKGFEALTQEQNTDLWKRTGEILEPKLNNLIASPKYQDVSNEDKSKAIEKFVERAKLMARVEKVIELTDGLSGEELKNKISELKAGGLITKEVFTKYQELR